ncbi:uncharacterized protein I303_101629 [Kwoniella dejecticola CBS 10117]|uniref:Uncharacterized protein n=1 Tax=Kwoniella dejecticola CBS 10117 TaxID=1296121 RepID=A0A1A6AD96_9TREE|nr:uncharacterized protein I303_02235 [Kwoniella dejecticola CBS 10117]OBR88018.1 hypothetical protein I303_02235 [Kwoniella dejecticola CBS 10117]
MSKSASTSTNSSTSTSDNPLDGICQTIHATLLSPPAQFLLVSDVKHDQWSISLFSDLPEGTAVWASSDPIKLSEFDVTHAEIAQAIEEGLIHVDCGSRRHVNLSELKEIDVHILTKPDPMIINVKQADMKDNVSALLKATFQLLARPQPKVKVNGNSSTDDVRELKLQLSQKDSEIANLNSRLSSLKATVVRATASDVNKKKVQQSPQKAKPLPGASQLQPNQKRRKVVEDEFAGSSSDDE